MTTTVLVVILVLAAFVVAAMTMRGSGNPTPPTRTPGAGSEATIDRADEHQVALLLNMTGGTCSDAATARDALDRFERERGRKATTRDVDVLAGMMRASR